MSKPIKVEVSAPTKIILFGEHSVVWGKPAIATAINLRTYVSMEEADEITVEPRDLMTYPIRFIWNQSKDEIHAIPNVEITKRLMEFTKSTMNVVASEFGLRGAKAEIKSTAPIAVGLGSSASVIVASLFAGARLAGSDVTLSALSSKAYKIEKEVQGYGSPTDTKLATYGGYFWIEDERCEPLDIRHKLPIVVGNTGIRHSTKDLIKSVKNSTDKHRSIFTPIHDSIGEITRRAREILEKKELTLEDYKETGFLMNVNNGLLQALGVGIKESSLFVEASLQAGAWGAKITGAGGGGAVIALVSPEKKDSIIAVLKSILGTYTPKHCAMYVDVCAKGVREEK